MISKYVVRPTLPAADIARARRFYSEKLGLEPEMEVAGGELLYKCKSSWFVLYPSQYAGTAQNTAAEFVTDNLEQDMKELRSKGITFEEYDLPGLKTINGMVTMGMDKVAWFKDSEGNILALSQMSNSPK
jgi:catechol 2,3-dioxygenase-like lactoylglutathione lyase family enzyme